MARIRLFLIEANRALIEATCALLADNEQIEFVGAADSLEQARGALVRLRPDLVLLDLVQSDQMAFSMIRTIKRIPSAPHVVVMSLYDAPLYRNAALAAGADGFISKADLFSELDPAIAALRPRRRPITGALQPSALAGAPRVA
ncbi:MAG: response regulator [Oscillochloridaceae bacterium umkhey_bin13]